MATVSETTRSTRITLGSLSAGPFNVGFRIFDTDGLKVYVDGEVSTDWTISATFVNGYTDAATITFGTALPSATVIQIDGALIPGRSDDYVNPDPGLTEKVNIELARLWAAVSENRMLALRSVRALSEIPATDGVTGSIVLEAAAAAEETLLARDEVLAVEATLPTWTGPWLTGTAYVFGDLAQEGGSTYFCIVNHTAGTFSTDLAAMRWAMFAQKGTSGVGIGDVLAANNGTEFNAATFRTNLGLAIGTNVQAYNQLLGAVSGLASNGIIARLSGSAAAVRTITGTADQILVTNGDGVAGSPTIAAVIASQAEAEAGVQATKLMTPERVAQAIALQAPRMALQTEITASGQVNMDWTGIPSWVTRINIILNALSRDTTDPLLVQLGDSGGFETTAYTSACFHSTGTTVGNSAATSGFHWVAFSAASTWGGLITICRLAPTGASSNIWVASGVLRHSGSPGMCMGAGTKGLSDNLTSVRLTAAAGTWDGGIAGLSWE